MEGPNKRLKPAEDDDNFEMARLHVNIAGGSAAAGYVQKAHVAFQQDMQSLFNQFPSGVSENLRTEANGLYVNGRRHLIDLAKGLKTGFYKEEDALDRLDGAEYWIGSLGRMIERLVERAAEAKAWDDNAAKQAEVDYENKQTLKALLRGPVFTEGTFDDDPHRDVWAAMEAASDEEHQDMATADEND